MYISIPIAIAIAVIVAGVASLAVALAFIAGNQLGPKAPGSGPQPV